MKAFLTIASALFVVVCCGVAQSKLQATTDYTTQSEAKPIVAIAQRINGSLSIKIHPNSLPGKDPLRVFNALHDKFGSDYPVVAIVDSNAKISDLYEVAGIAGKAGFDKIRTFIYHKENGKMFEVKYGAALPFSINGPFDRIIDDSTK